MRREGGFCAAFSCVKTLVGKSWVSLTDKSQHNPHDRALAHRAFSQETAPWTSQWQ